MLLFVPRRTNNCVNSEPLSRTFNGPKIRFEKRFKMESIKNNYENLSFSELMIKEEIKKFDQWFVHTDFGNGIVARSTAWPDAPMYSRHMGVSKFDYIVKPNLPNLQGKRILELGCNNGLNSIHMCRLGAKEVVGIDSPDYWADVINQAHFVKKAIEWRCNQSFNITYLEQNMSSIPELDLGKFDVVIALNSLYYLEENDIARVMKHIAKISDTFLIQCNTLDQKHLGGRSNPGYMKKMLLKNGFKYVTVDKRWDTPRKGFIPKRYHRPVVVGTNNEHYCSASDTPW